MIGAKSIPSIPIPSISALGENTGTVIARHIDLTFRKIMPGPNVVIEQRFLRLVTGEQHPFGNFVCMSDPPSADAAGTQAAIEPLLHCNAPAAVLCVGPVSQAVESVLDSAGFARHPGLPAMAVDIENLATTDLPPGYALARVSKSSQREAWAEVFARGYGLPLPVGAAFARGINGDDSRDAAIQYFWILKDARPVCTSLMYLHEGVAGIYGVATLAEERGKGLGAFATAHPLRAAHALGYRVGVLQSSADGHPVYRRIGFADFGELPLYIRMPA